MKNNKNNKNIFGAILESIQVFRKQKIRKIKFRKEDLIELDRIQNNVLGTFDSCQSVGYKSDKEIFELCLEIIKHLTLNMLFTTGFMTRPNPKDYPEYMDFIFTFLNVYYSKHFNNTI